MRENRPDKNGRPMYDKSLGIQVRSGEVSMLPIITNVRPNAPQGWAHSAAALNLVWHHVLPYNTLRDVWNLLVNAFHDTQLPEARTAIRQYLRLCRRSLPDLDALLGRLKKDTLTAWECESLASAAVWPAWNIVEGPKSRSDDPGNTYIDRFTAGLTPDESVRMRGVERFYLSISTYASLRVVTAADLSGIALAAASARAVLAGADKPIPFRESMWERGEDGRWRKQR
jgi:hypothetical protein